MRRVVTVAALILRHSFASASDNDAEEDDRVSSAAASDEPIPDKVGVEVHLSKSERSVLEKLECDMCKSVVREMHIEVDKHAMTQKGWGSESQVWETSNAICMALLQKYKLSLSPAKLELKAEDDEELSMTASGDEAQALMRGMLVLKMGCYRWVEDYGGDVSGFVFKRVRDGSSSANQTAKEFCIQANQCGRDKKEKRREDRERALERQKKREALAKKEEKKEKKRLKDDPMEALPADSKAGLQRLLEMAKDDPFHYMEDAAKQRVNEGRKDLRCDVCHAAIAQVHSEVMQRPESMRREYDILPFIDGACEGGRDLSVPAYFGVEPPPLPPTWTDLYRPKLNKKTGKYELKPFPKAAAKKRRKWRQLSETGKQKPPDQDESEADLMLTLTCKDSSLELGTSEVLYAEMQRCRAKKCDAALATAMKVCRDATESPCKYPKASQGNSEL